MKLSKGQRQFMTPPPGYQEQATAGQDMGGVMSATDALMPDAPIPETQSEMLRALMSNDAVPEKVREKYYHIFLNDNVLTFLDDERKRRKLLAFDIIRIDTLNALPYYDYDFETEKELSKMRLIYETKLDRALGTNEPNRKNERIVQQSQFSEQTMRQDELRGVGMAKPGFFKRLFGRQ